MKFSDTQSLWLMRLIDKVIYPAYLIFAAWQEYNGAIARGHYSPQFFMNIAIGAIIFVFLLISTRPQKARISSQFIAGILLFRCFIFFEFDLLKLGLSPMGQVLWIGSNCLVLLCLGITYFYIGRSLGISPAYRKLIQKGPYRLMRHPIYGLWLSLVASQIFIFPSLRNLGAVLAMALGVWLLAQNEEALLSEFPEYVDYKKSIRFQAFHPLLLLPLLLTLGVRIFMSLSV